MNKKIIFQKIGGILTEINEQYQYLSGNMESINDLELELFVANANFLSEHAIILKRINEAQAPVQEAVAPVQVKPKDMLSAPPVIETTPIKPSFEDTAVSPEPVRETESTFVSTIQDKKEEPAPVFSVPAVETVKPVEVVSEAKPVTEFVETTDQALEYQPTKNNPAPTLNDILSEKNSQNTISRQYHSQSSDLKSMVNLNDKLLFVKDLFNGYSLAYSEAVELANRCNSYEDAIAFLQATYAGKNKWADKQSAVSKFYEILSRRFPK